MLVAATSPERARRASALLEQIGSPGWQIRFLDFNAAAEEIAVGSVWDVLVAVYSPSTPEIDTAFDAIESMTRGASVVLLVDEYTEEAAMFAHRYGTRVSLVAHGTEAFRAALQRAARIAIERREREDSRAAERVRSLIYSNVTDVILYLSVDGGRFRFVDINDSFTRATGLTRADVVGKLVEDVIPEPSLSIVMGHYREAIERRRTVQWEEVTEYPSGVKYGEVSATPVFSDTGECIGLVGTVHDVTDARRRDELIRLYANVVASMQIGLTVWERAAKGDAAALTLKAANPAASTTLGIDLTSLVEAPFAKVFPDSDRSLVSLVNRVSANNAASEIPAYEVVSADGHKRTFNIKAFPLTSNDIGVAFEDITSQARARAMYEAEQLVLEQVASGASLTQTLSRLVSEIEPMLAGARASVWLFAPDELHVQMSAGPHIDRHFVRALESVPTSELRGLCGSPNARRAPMFTPDLAKDERWGERRELAARAGLRACWSFPILASDWRALGLFAVFDTDTRSPTDDDLEIAARATNVASMAIQRHQLDEHLRALSVRIEGAREEERTGIAREIHDELGQALTALKFDLAWIARRVAGPVTDAQVSAALGERLRAMMTMTDEVIQRVRRISSDLRPGVLDDLGLFAAIEWQAQQFEKRTGVTCLVRSNIGDRRLERGLSTALFRVFQEAITNTARHANASRIDGLLETQGERLRLEVRDDGVGLPAGVVSSPTSLGLLGMKERLRRFGGTVTVASDPNGRGTCVTVEVPFAD